MIHNLKAFLVERVYKIDILIASNPRYDAQMSIWTDESNMGSKTILKSYLQVNRNVLRGPEKDILRITPYIFSF